MQLVACSSLPYLCQNFNEYMLQISYIRQNTALVKEKLAVKHFGDLSIVDTILETDEQVRKLKTETEALQAAHKCSQ